MSTCYVEESMLKDLVAFKLRHVIYAIDDILGTWGYTDATKFVNDARDGTLQEAEMDAIALRQLLADREQLDAVQARWRST